MIPINLSDKVAVITGGAQGLGKATALMLRAAGARVVINYLDDSEGLGRRIADDALLELGEGSLAVDADVRSTVSRSPDRCRAARKGWRRRCLRGL